MRKEVNQLLMMETNEYLEEVLALLLPRVHQIFYHLYLNTPKGIP